jgi:hypothetical protein
MGKDSDVPQPGPARLAKGAGPDEWLEQAKQCKYLPEADMKRLCEIVKECLMEGMWLLSGKSKDRGRFLEPLPHFPAPTAATAQTTLFRCIYSNMPCYRRIEHPARPDSCHSVWRHTWPILRPPRALPGGRRYAQ